MFHSITSNMYNQYLKCFNEKISNKHFILEMRSRINLSYHDVSSLADTRNFYKHVSCYYLQSFRFKKICRYCNQPIKLNLFP